MVFLGFTYKRKSKVRIVVEKTGIGILGAWVHFCPHPIENKGDNATWLDASIMQEGAAIMQEFTPAPYPRPFMAQIAARNALGSRQRL